MRFLCLLLLAACSNQDAALETLQSAGYTNIETTGWVAFMCGKDDTFSTGFIATNPAGKRVEGAVCGGWGKGYTIRF